MSICVVRPVCEASADVLERVERFVGAACCAVKEDEAGEKREYDGGGQ